MQIEITRALAYAAGQDAANRQMRQAGRVVWSKADYEKAIEVFNRLWPSEFDKTEKGQELDIVP